MTFIQNAFKHQDTDQGKYYPLLPLTIAVAM